MNLEKILHMVCISVGLEYSMPSDTKFNSSQKIPLNGFSSEESAQRIQLRGFRRQTDYSHLIDNLPIVHSTFLNVGTNLDVEAN